MTAAQEGRTGLSNEPPVDGNPVEGLRATESIAGSYIGGPRRRSPLPSAGVHRVDTVEDIRRRADNKRLRQRRARRNRRTIVVLSGSMLLGAATGWTWGWLSRTSPNEIAAESVDAASGDKIDQQVNRVLEELWRMEAAERAPSIGIR